MLIYIYGIQKKWHLLTYFQGRKGGTDREHVCGHNMGREGKLC